MLLVVAFGLLVAAGLADVLTTRAALKTGRLEEANPLMRPFVGTLPRALTVKGVGLVIAGVVIFDTARTSPDLALVTTLLGAMFFSTLAWRNDRLRRAVVAHDADCLAARRLSGCA